LVLSSKSEQRLECRHRRLPPIVTKYEFIEINLELITADAVMSSEQVTAGRCKWCQKLLQRETLTRTWLGS
jgi:hypothetical protein